jgi:hypothetical protein
MVKGPRAGSYKGHAPNSKSKQLLREYLLSELSKGGTLLLKLAEMFISQLLSLGR